MLSYNSTAIELISVPMLSKPCQMSLGMVISHFIRSVGQTFTLRSEVVNCVSGDSYRARYTGNFNR